MATTTALATTQLEPAENPWGKFSATQAKEYANNRRSYSQNLYDTVLEFHKTTGGGFESLVDVGCGPGVAVRDLGPQFTTAVGLDPSQGMIDIAQSLGGSAASGPIIFEPCAAEQLEPSLLRKIGISGGGVDLIIAANSAHYFDPKQFWARAARVLRPGGSVAAWFSRPVGMHKSVPNGRAIEEILSGLQKTEMEPFEKIRLRESSNGSGSTPRQLDDGVDSSSNYCGLLMPWDEQVQDPNFDETLFLHKEWSGRDTEGEEDEFFVSQPRVDLDTMERIMSATAGPYLEWKKANPGLVGTEQDLLKRSRREIERLQREVGVKAGEEWVKSSVMGTLVIVKKKTKCSVR
ncbi:methyltransferase domain-containing protein [Diaporthe helianthi]|uniref:Methyltransferase domain-containing protein n=1 Tax=Diaporthe helianthi TaxID=158607 RepID=A0A2P5HUM3_DIAHE|nr:methyltransferase domain-containing protein [Diaporthe helianthi]